MPDNAVTKSVFLDTQVYDSVQLDFANANLARLIRLADEGIVTLFITSVTENEIRKHINDKAEQTARQIHGIYNASQFVRRALPPPVLDAIKGFDQESFRKQLHKQFDAFLAEAGVRRLEVNDVSADTVFAWYFTQMPPFGTGAKKSEFPDAFAIAALEQWCVRNGTKMYAVSGDEDWKKSCDKHDALIHLSRLDALLEEFADSSTVSELKAALFEMDRDLIKLIESSVKEMTCFFDDTAPNGQATRIQSNGGELQYPRVVEIAEKTGVLSVPYTFYLEIDVIADDADRDRNQRPDDGCQYRRQGTITREISRDVIVTMEFSRKNPSDAKILSAVIDNETIPVTIKEGELRQVIENEKRTQSWK